MNTPLRWASAAFVSLAFGCETPPPIREGNRIYLPGANLEIEQPLVSVRERRFVGMVPQRLDYSCGAAAMATILQYFYDDPVSEDEILVAMLEVGDHDAIRSKGFSLLDLKKYAEARGYQTQGMRVAPEVLDRLAAPAITLVNTRGFGHFVVIKGVRDGVVFLADPALGNRSLSRERFVQEWSGALFFVAAKRPPDAWSPLQELSVRDTAPNDWVQELTDPGLNAVRTNRTEF